MPRFNLVGTTYEKDGKWGARVTLDDMMTRNTTIDSGLVYKDEKEAEIAMRHKVNELLEAFDKDGGIKIIRKEEGKVQ